uniref:DUF2497 domain-containing protein n=1 Tax=Agrobacterium albertimagni TaxID=147266 RepID=A0A7C1NYC7_9HYPH
MAQPSVAREPSMEEILASIRRIIESNDPVNGGSLTQDAASPSDDQGESDEDMGYDGGEFVAANDAGSAFPLFPQRDMERAEAEPRREPVLEQVSEAPKSVSLADLAARVRSASERTERPNPPQLSNTTAHVTVSQPRRDSEFSAEDAQHRAPAPMMATRLSEMRDQQFRHQHQKMAHQASQQHTSQQRLRTGADEGADEAQDGGSSQGRSDDEMPEEQRALPEIPSFGLAEKEGAIDRRQKRQNRRRPGQHT